MNNANLNFEALTQGLPSKSEKIRTLGRAGASTGEIARFLGIRYQFARNVLVDAGLRGGQQEPVQNPAAPAAVAAAEQSVAADGWLRTSADGALVIPAAFLVKLGIRAGDAALVRLADDCLEVLSQAAGLARAQELVRQYVPAGTSLVEELISDRRAAAAAEDAA